MFLDVYGYMKKEKTQRALFLAKMIVFKGYPEFEMDLDLELQRRQLLAPAYGVFFNLNPILTLTS